MNTDVPQHGSSLCLSGSSDGDGGDVARARRVRPDPGGEGRLSRLIFDSVRGDGGDGGAAVGTGSLSAELTVGKKLASTCAVVVGAHVQSAPPPSPHRLANRDDLISEDSLEDDDGDDERWPPWPPLGLEPSCGEEEEAEIMCDLFAQTHPASSL